MYTHFSICGLLNTHSAFQEMLFLPDGDAKTDLIFSNFSERLLDNKSLEGIYIAFESECIILLWLFFCKVKYPFQQKNKYFGVCFA